MGKIVTVNRRNQPNKREPMIIEDIKEQSIKKKQPESMPKQQEQILDDKSKLVMKKAAEIVNSDPVIVTNPFAKTSVNTKSKGIFSDFSESNKQQKRSSNK